MNSSGLKAREIEALVFTQSLQRTPLVGPRQGPAAAASRWLTAGAAAITIVAAALAWVVVRR